MRFYYPLVILVFLICLLVGLNGRQLPFGFRTLVLRSDSMISSLPPGSLIFVHRQDSYQPGDVISFWTKIDGQTELVTHRIAKLGGNTYITKGDDNTKNDLTPVVPRLIEGKTLFFIPILGLIIEFFRSRLGLAVIMIPVSFIFYHEIKNLYQMLKSNHKDESN